jgi:hypothetical protein
VTNLLLERMSFKQLLAVSDPRRVTRSLTVRGPPLKIRAYQDAVYWAFNFKSFPSTTGLRHHGYVKFAKPTRQKPLEQLDCVVDCTCPDYRYRWAWANKQRGSSLVGQGSMNRAWNRAPRVTNPTGSPGLCKHIIHLREYIQGLLSPEVFPAGVEDTGDALNTLIRYADNRWTAADDDQDNLDHEAQAREAAVQQTAAQRNQGQLPSSAPPPSTLAPGLPAPPKENDNPQNQGNETNPANDPNVPDDERVTKSGFSTAAEYNFRRRQGLGDSLTSRVDTIDMTDLKDVLKLVEELEQDERGAESDAPPLPNEVPGDEVGGDLETDQESEALAILREIRDFVAQIAGEDLEVAEPTPGEEYDGDTEGADSAIPADANNHLE